tara:strand:+ start:1904 stop:2476 length:573 start_codon:yes stop_codon:yes gene_type:complete
MLQAMTLLAALAAQAAAIFPEGRYVERLPSGALDCEAASAAEITIRVRQIERHEELRTDYYTASAGLISFNLDGGRPPYLYAIREGVTPLGGNFPGNMRIEAARITTAGRYTDSVFEGGTTGGLSAMLTRHDDGDIEIVELWENDQRGVRSAAAPDRIIVAVNAGSTDGGMLASTGRILRQFGACPAPAE